MQQQQQLAAALHQPVELLLLLPAAVQQQQQGMQESVGCLQVGLVAAKRLLTSACHISRLLQQL
jgi:hypothetical protein